MLAVIRDLGVLVVVVVADAVDVVVASADGRFDVVTGTTAMANTLDAAATADTSGFTRMRRAMMIRE